VLTSRELKQFVDTEVPAGQPKAPSQWSWFGDTEPNTLLRQLLARRLMREGQLAQAQPYFVEPQLQELAKQYQQLQQASKSAWLDSYGVHLHLDLGQLKRAQALFELAALTRAHGLELLGYEMAPDFQVFYGQFAYEEQDNAGTDSSNWLIPDLERARVAQSVAVPNQRFHYRYLAAELAARSADLWPQNSQAFAASLCHATTWLINRDPQQAHQYYQRYLQQGPYVRWGADFGIACPEPDTVSARKRLHSNFKASLPSGRRLLAASTLVLLLVTAGWLWWRRRQHL